MLTKFQKWIIEEYKDMPLSMIDVDDLRKFESKFNNEYELFKDDLSNILDVYNFASYALQENIQASYAEDSQRAAIEFYKSYILEKLDEIEGQQEMDDMNYERDWDTEIQIEKEKDLHL